MQTATLFSFSADINECSEGTSGCTESCINTQGGFQCGCSTGFTLGGDGMTCIGRCFYLRHYHFLLSLSPRADINIQILTSCTIQTIMSVATVMEDACKPASMSPGAFAAAVSEAFNWRVMAGAAEVSLGMSRLRKC